MSITDKYVVTGKHVEAIESLLPFLFNVRGAGEAAAKDAAESLMELLDTSVLPAGAHHSTADVLVFRSRGL